MIVKQTSYVETSYTRKRTLNASEHSLFRDYKLKTFAADLVAVVAGFLISALGGSRVQIGGSTGAFVVIVAGIIAKFGVSGFLMVTLMAGVLPMLMGVTGLGAAVKLIPHPVTIGFINGIAL